MCNRENGVVVPIPTFPELEINTKLEDPEVIVKEPVPKLTEADTDPVAICDKFNPVIPDAGILNNPAPDPTKDPENDAVLYELVKALNDAVVVKDPVTLSKLPVGPTGP
jgi:histidinol-phosphate/aromatic aminotransferase/cobyric acid decarboxylase-like protein